MKLLHHPLALLLITVLVIFGVLRSFSAPDPVPADAPADVFSAARAEVILRHLLRENQPHVSGTGANDLVRDRITALLESAGYEFDIQARYHCNPAFGKCSPVENIIAVRKGSEGQDAILLTTHYDSVFAGPGAADDGAGTAALLEIAQMMAAQPEPLNDIIFLITDAEEQGLVGAHAFATHHPLFSKVRLVINLEARGAAGPSAMFETGDGNRRLIRRLAEILDRPVANSLTYAVYKRMPNDTDYSVYKREGVMGLNFAFVQGVALYHSKIDDPDHLAPGSLQHHGDNAWALVKALKSYPLKRLISKKENAGYIDLFAMKLLHYPVSIEGGLALVLVVLVLIAIILFRSREMQFGWIFWSFCTVILVLLCIPAGAWLLSWPLGGWLDVHPLEHPYPWLARLALFMEVVLCLWLAMRLCGRRASAGALLLVSWLLIGVLGLVLANLVPTAAYIALIPLTAFVIGVPIDLLRMRRGEGLVFASLLGFAAAVYMALYHFFMLAVIFNFDRSHIMILPLGLAAVASLPLLAQWRSEDSTSWLPARVMLAAILAVCLAHSFVPGYTADRPRPMNLVYQEESGGQSGQLILESMQGAQDDDFIREAGFQDAVVQSLSGEEHMKPAVTVPLLGLPRLSTLVGPVEPGENGEKRYKISLLAPEGLQQLAVHIPEGSGLVSAWLNDELALDTSLDSKYELPGDTVILLHPGTRTVQLELVTDGSGLPDLPVVSRYAIPDTLIAPYIEHWPIDSQPNRNGHRALIYETIVLPKQDD